jgi:hypothetical protein
MYAQLPHCVREKLKHTVRMLLVLLQPAAAWALTAIRPYLWTCSKGVMM